MKKIALIILAVASMVLVSCRGGKDEGLKPAEPAITYESANNDYKTDLRDCLKVKNVIIRENGLYDVSVTAQIEMVKEPSEPIQWISTGVELLDKNGAQICGESGFLGGFTFQGVSRVGDVGSASCKIETEVGLPASKVIKEAKCYRIINAWGRVNDNAKPSFDLQDEVMVVDQTDINAYIYDADGDFTNIRNSPKGTVIDKIPCGQGRFGAYLDKESNGWWHVRDSKVYDTQTGKYRDLNGDDCWIHKSIVKFEKVSGADDGFGFDDDSDFSDLGSADWDKILDEYEQYVNKYYSFAEKVSKGNASALADALSMSEKAASLAEKLDRADDNLSTAQANRLLRIQNKMAEAAIKMAGASSNVEDMMNDFDEDDLDDAINSLLNFGDDD